jgi:MFS family permease
MVAGFFLMTITTIGLGAMTKLKDPTAFMVAGNILRFIQGLGDVWLQFTAYSVITTIFSHDIMTYIKYIEIAVGLGLGLGPVAGDVLFELLDFELSMYCFGVLNFLTLMICALMIPNELNITASETEVNEEEVRMRTLSNIENLRKKEKIGWRLMFTNRHSFFAVLIALVGTFDIMFFKGFLALELEEKGFGENTGYIMAIPALVYLVACLLLPYTCEHTSRKFLFTFSMFGFAVCMFLLGPSKLLGFPDNVWLIVSSQPPMGILQVFVFIPIIPEMIERLQVDLDIAEGENEEVDLALNDQVNECYTLLYAFANGVSPLIGGLMHDNL